MNNCNNLFFKAGNLNLTNFDFLKRFGTLYDLLIDLRNEKISTLTVAKEQIEMINKIEEIKDFILLQGKGIINKNTQSIKKAETKTKTKKTKMKRQKSDEENQKGQGLKILTPDQILSRLTIFLAQLKARNNSEKLRNAIRQLLSSLYRSKKLTKSVYKYLVSII